MEPTVRVWTGDTEVVYETAHGFEWFVAEFVGGTRRFVCNHAGGGVEVRLVGTEPSAEDLQAPSRSHGGG